MINAKSEKNSCSKKQRGIRHRGELGRGEKHNNGS